MPSLKQHTARILACCLSLLWLAPAHAAFDHSTWNTLLQTHVRLIDGGQATQVDYAGMAAERAQLEQYLQSLSVVQRDNFEQWSQDEQLAFLINAYNAWTVELVLGAYPGLRSIRDIGGLLRSPWRRDIVELFGERFTLDNIEHDMIRGWGRYNNPLIHFAVNCASVGCPALRNEAYIGDRLQAQLDEQTRLFLQDRSRNYRDGQTLYLSSVFRWYPEDFEKGWLGYDSLLLFIKAYAAALDLTPDDVMLLESGRIRIRYLRYGWRLNDLQQELRLQ
jgi:hypothetical protein